MGILDIDLNNINLDNTNCDEDDPETIIHIKLLTKHLKFEKRLALKKEFKKELIAVSWHPKQYARAVVE